MLVMNKAKTVAMAFCPIGSFLFKDDKPLIFPMRYVYKNEEWNPEPVDPSGGGLVPIPDCIRKNRFISFAQFCYYTAPLQSHFVHSSTEHRRSSLA